MLKRFVDVFRQCKQSFNNKNLQLVSIIKNNLINELNTIYKEVVFREFIYTKKDSFSSLCSLSNMSSFARFVRCQTCRALFALLVVEHVDNRAICYRLLL